MATPLPVPPVPYSMLSTKELAEEAKYRPTLDLCTLLGAQIEALESAHDAETDREIEGLEETISELEDEKDDLERECDKHEDLIDTLRNAIEGFDTEASTPDNTRVFITTLLKDFADYDNPPGKPDRPAPPAR